MTCPDGRPGHGTLWAMHEFTDEDVDEIIRGLHQRYGDTFSLRRVVKEVTKAREFLEPKSKHPDFLGILIEKRAREALHKRAKQRGETLHPVPEILFVCVHNEGRSPMAGAFAEFFGGDHVFIRTAGTEPTGQVNTVVQEVMAERGIPIHDFPTAVSGGPRHVPDFVIHVGEHIPDLPGHRQLTWPVRDPHGQPVEVVREIAADIETRVRDLLASIGVPVSEHGHDDKDGDDEQRGERRGEPADAGAEGRAG